MVSGLVGGIAGGTTVAITIRAVDKFSKEFNKAKTGMEVMTSAVKVLGAASAVAFGAFAASAIDAGLKMKPIEDSFKKLTKGADKFLFELNQTTKGTISNFELMANANKALLLGLDQEALPNLFKNAAIVGRAAGRSTTEAIEDITLGIGRQSRLILDNLGIILKADDVYKEFAESIGKATSDLTAQEKQIAFNSAAMDALQESADKLGGAIPEDAITDIQRLTKGYADFRTEFGKAFIENFSVALPQAEKDWASFGKTTGDVLGIIAAGSVAAFKVFQVGIISITGVMTSGLLASAKMWEKIINFFISNINKVSGLLGFEDVGKIGEVDFTSGLLRSVESQAEKTKGLVDDINTILSDVNTSFRDIGKSQENVIDNAQKQKEVIKAISKEQELVNKLSGFKVLPTTGDIFNPGAFSKQEFESKFGFEQAKRGAGIEINIENVIGLDPEEISRALSDELNNKNSL